MIDDKLKAYIKQVGVNFGRSMPDAMVDGWASELRPYGGAALQALQDAARAITWPTLGAVLEKARGQKAADHAKVMPRALEGRARAASDQAQVNSMIWLHLVNGWAPTQFEGTVYERLFQRAEREPGEFLRAAIAAGGWTKDSINAWMEDALRRAAEAEARERRNNTPQGDYDR